MDELELLAKNVIEVSGQDENRFKIGYHSEPSMQRLHLHVISDDFNSTSLKTKIHWNSFNTKFFWNVHGMLDVYALGLDCFCKILLFLDVHREIKQNGKVHEPSADISKKLLTTALQCHKCDFSPKNMPDLKQHLMSHITWMFWARLHFCFMLYRMYHLAWCNYLKKFSVSL